MWISIQVLPNQVSEKSFCAFDDIKIQNDNTTLRDCKEIKL